MDRQTLDRFYAENVGLVHGVARKGYARLTAIGASIDYNDLVQELAAVFVKAFDAFDDTASVKFSTYFQTAAYNRLNAIAEEFELERLGVAIERSKDGKVKKQMHAGLSSFEEITDRMGGEDESFSILELIEDGSRPVPESIEWANLFAYVKGRVSPLASRMLEFMLETPALLERELDAQMAHAEHARAQGIARRSRLEPGFGFVIDMLRLAGVSRTDIDHARLELQRAFKEGGYEVD